MALRAGARGTAVGLATTAHGLPPPAAHRGPAPRLAAILFLILALAPEIKLRGRDPTQTYTGSPDIQILIELVFYAAVGLWIIRYALRGMAAGSYPLSALDANAAALLFVTALILVSGAFSLSVLSGIRALQFAEFSSMTLLLLWEGRRDHEFFPRFWLWLRRGMVAFAVAAVLATLAVPGWRTAIGDDDFRSQRERAGLAGFVFNRGLDPHQRRFRRHFRRGDKNTPVADAQPVRQSQPDVAINARAGVPPGV